MAGEREYEGGVSAVDHYAWYDLNVGERCNHQWRKE
jgi:hypothetical protein